MKKEFLVLSFYPPRLPKKLSYCQSNQSILRPGYCSTFLHADYQGLTKSFNHGKIYCSCVTAKLVNMNIGIPFEKLHVLPLNETTNISGIDVTFLDANHCPGSVIILFQPPSGKVWPGLTSQ